MADWWSLPLSGVVSERAGAQSRRAVWMNLLARCPAGDGLQSPRGMSLVLGAVRMVCGAGPCRLRRGRRICSATHNLGISDSVQRRKPQCPVRQFPTCPDGVRRRGDPVTNLSHNAPMHPCERIAPSQPGKKHPRRHDAKGAKELQGAPDKQGDTGQLCNQRSFGREFFQRNQRGQRRDGRKVHHPADE